MSEQGRGDPTPCEPLDPEAKARLLACLTCPESLAAGVDASLGLLSEDGVLHVIKAAINAIPVMARNHDLELLLRTSEAVAILIQVLMATDIMHGKDVQAMLSELKGLIEAARAKQSPGQGNSELFIKGLWDRSRGEAK